MSEIQRKSLIIMKGYIIACIVAGPMFALCYDMMLSELDFWYFFYLVPFLGIGFVAFQLMLFLCLLLITSMFCSQINPKTYSIVAMVCYIMMILLSYKNRLFENYSLYSLDVPKQLFYWIPSTPPYWNEQLVIHATQILLWALAVYVLWKAAFQKIALPLSSLD